jgi:hypothetical protein
MLSTVCPRLGGRTLVLAPCERLGDPAREVRYWRFAPLGLVASNFRLLTKAELASRYRASVYLFTA